MSIEAYIAKVRGGEATEAELDADWEAMTDEERAAVREIAYDAMLAAFAAHGIMPTGEPVELPDAR